MFADIFKRSGSVSGGNLTVYDDFWYNVGMSGPSKSGQPVSRKAALQLAYFFACVTLISDTLATFPLKVKQKVGDSTRDATEIPLFHLLKNKPNPKMTSFTWRQSGQGHLLTSGNKYSWIERNNQGVRGLWPIKPNEVKPRVATPQEAYKMGLDERDNVVYDVQDRGQKRIIPARDMLHVKGFGDDGLVGESVVSNFAKEVAGSGLTLQEFLGRFFKNGMHIGGTLQHPETLGDNAEKFKESLKNWFSSQRNAGKPLILENGMEYKQHKISLVDQQFLELSGMTDLQICGIFRVPPSLVGIFGSGTSYNSTEMQGLNFLNYCMLAHVKNDEQAMEDKLLSPEQLAQGYFIKYNFDALLRTDAKTRAEIDNMEWRQGVPKNVLLDRDDRNPIEGGDRSYHELNMISDEAEANLVAEGQRSECGCGHEHRKKTHFSELRDDKKKLREKLAARDRISERYEKLIQKTAERLVNREVRAIKREAEKNLKERALFDFTAWMDDFYKNAPEMIQREMGPVILAYQEAIADQTADEIGGVFANKATEVLSKGYTAGLSRQWVDSSVGQLSVLLEDTDKWGKIIKRADDWGDKRAFKVALQQRHAAANAVASAVYAANGYKKIVWANRGKENCPFCSSMEGRVVDTGGIFLDAQSKIQLEGEETFHVRNNVRYPPLHGGCDCVILPE